MMKYQRGMTLVELLVAAAITALVAGGVGPAIIQFMLVTDSISDGLAAWHDARIATYWIAHDVQMAQTTDLVDGSPPVSAVTLEWTDKYAEGNVDHTSSYSLVGQELRRNYDGQVMIVARYVSGVEFSLAGRTITVRVVSSVGSTSREGTASFYLRPNG
jgi:prepilin-type N-terminal cleavage/methylation domain-containing protein